MKYWELPASYDAWKTATPPEWDQENECEKCERVECVCEEKTDELGDECRI